MAPKEIVFYKEHEDKLDTDDAVIEPCVLIPAAVSTLSINDLSIRKGSFKKISWLTRFSGIIYTLTSSFISTCAIFSIKQLGVNLIDAFILRFIIQIPIMLLFASYKHYPLISGTSTQIFLQILCCTTGAGCFFLYFFAVRYVELSDVTTLCYTRVVWTVIFSIVIYRERPSISSLIALPLTILGVIFVSQPSFLFSSTNPSIVIVNSQFRLLGLSLAIASALASAANVLSFKKLVSTSKPIKPSIINIQYCVAVIVFLIIYELYRKFFLHDGLTLNYIISWRYLLASVLCVVMIIPNILSQKAMKREHPAIYLLLTSADIIFSLILQNIFTEKRSNLFALLGSALVILSVVILGFSKIITERRTQKKLKLMDIESIMNDLEENK
ncbi:unnamed protein product [Rotaria sp. Silwood2]|nr:unnamed protein product [Rotaria sp. Silwood2]CAF2708949.1 unnamed protein product [Rotaria sp. Silwood2]CAF2973628.1 unnamed protein product [Rotaria sp. Silwood2]CAF3119084.1 unnamed protein product [Rotaria sp. Silwood2]CAF3864396.1 unnamed protein product [Rotaria sp. Silwood2]